MRSRILFFILFILAASCVTVELCDESYDSELVARLKTVKDGEVTDSTVAALTLWGIREGLSDSLLYDALPTSGFAVPLDPHHDFSSFVLQIDTLSDTLTVYHDFETYMVSYNCAYANLFTLSHIEYKGGIIKSDTILSEMIDAEYEENEEHIWLYL
ncbi:MAG: DUF6452 family protein [Bacteroidota bacterium]|nr:DUF6452 family protein [Bacteroidota bacterium]